MFDISDVVIIGLLIMFNYNFVIFVGCFLGSCVDEMSSYHQILYFFCL